MKIIKPPDPIEIEGPCVFLAGSIEMGKAINWQSLVQETLADEAGTILNPRRDDWNSALVQSADNPDFREQVYWELTGLQLADIIALFFDPLTKSPISLLELGLFARSGKMVVYCPEGFWRKGNVDIVCQTYNVPRVESVDALSLEIQRRIHKLQGVG